MNRFSPSPMALLALLACSSCASAEDPELEKVRASVVKNLPGIEAEMVTRSPAPGLYQIQKGALYGYVTADGRYLISGDMIDIVDNIEITENQRSKARLVALEKFGPDQVIEFPAKDNKYMVTVFTDIDCGYCRKLHQDMEKYHEAGIGIRYLFYPRSGPNTPSFAKAQQVWCSADRQKALTEAKRGVHLDSPTNCTNPVLAQYQAGEAVGVMATPTLILPDGELVRGYVRAAPLAARLAQGDTTKSARATAASR